MKHIQKGKRLPPTVEYLKQLEGDSYVADYDNVEELLNPENIRKIFLYQSCERARKVAEKLGELSAEGIDAKEAWDYHSGIVLTEAAVAHTYYWIYQNFFRSIYFRTEN